MATQPEIEHPRKAFGWAARDPSGFLSPFNFSRRFTHLFIQYILLLICYSVIFSRRAHRVESTHESICFNSMQPHKLNTGWVGLMGWVGLWVWKLLNHTIQRNPTCLFLVISNLWEICQCNVLFFVRFEELFFVLMYSFLKTIKIYLCFLSLKLSWFIYAFFKTSRTYGCFPKFIHIKTYICRAC